MSTQQRLRQEDNYNSKELLSELNVHKVLGELHLLSHTQMWNEILSIQTQMLEGTDRKIIARPMFKEAKRILDFGTGNGQFLGLIHEEYPNKKLVGVDKDTGLIACAKNRFSSEKNVQLSNGDVYDSDFLNSLGKFDVIVLRLVVQHLPDVQIAIANLEKQLTPKGQIVIIDANPSLHKYSPSIPEYEKMAKFRNSQALSNQTKIPAIAYLAKYKSDQLIVKNNEDFIVRGGPETAIIKSRQLQLASEFVRRQHPLVKFSQKSLIKEIANWKNSIQPTWNIDWKLIVLSPSEL